MWTYFIRFLTYTISSFKIIVNKNDRYRGKNCMIKLCESLRKYAMKIFNFAKKKNKLLTKERKESYENVKICYAFK